MLRTAACVLLLVISSVCFAQPQYTIQHFTNENGLPVNGITCLAWDDAHQLLWVGTEAGLLCWDGQRLLRMENCADRIWTIVKRPDQRGISLYAQDIHGSIFKLTGVQCTYAGHFTTVLYKTYNIDETRSGAAFFKDIAAQRQGLEWYNWLVRSDSNKQMMVNYKHHIFLQREGRLDSLKEPVVGATASFMKYGTDILLVDGNKLYRYNAGDRTFTRQIIKNLPPGFAHYEFITQTNTSYPIISGEGKVYRLDKQGEQLSATLITEALPKYFQVLTMCVLGNTGYIAVGDYANGLYLLKRASVTPVGVTPANSLRRAFVAVGQASLPGARVLVESGFIFGRDGKVQYRPDLGTIVNYYAVGKHIFYNRFDTLCRYDTSSDKIEKTTLKDGSENVSYATTNGELYAISDYGIYTLHDFKPVLQYRLRQHGDRSGISYHFVTELSAGVLAIAHKNKVLFYHTATKHTDTVVVTKSADVRSLWAKGGYLFAGSYGEGIFVVTAHQARALPIDHEAYLKHTHCFVPDGRGYCYISTNNGLFKVSIRALLAAASGAQIPIYYHHLDKHDGLVATELNGGSQTAGLRMADGTLSFASMNGLAWVHPDDALTNAPTGIILGDSISVDAQKFAANDKYLAALPSRIDNIGFNITIPYWGAAENMYAWYRLVKNNEEDGAWTRFDPAIEHSFSFPALKPDHYRFEVKVLTGFEPGASKQLSIPFTIRNYWYLEWYSLLLWAVLWILFVIQLIRWSRKRLEKTIAERTTEIRVKNDLLHVQVVQLNEANTLRERLVSVISHNIIAPLKHIQLSSSILNSEDDLPARLKKRTADSIKQTSRELELLAVNLLTWIRLQHLEYDKIQPEQFQLAEVMEEVKNILLPIAKEHAQDIVVRHTDEACYQYKDAIKVMLYNLALNAVTYAKRGTITISSAHEHGILRLMVADEGVGMPAKKVNELLHILDPNNDSGSSKYMDHGFGYFIIKDLLKVTEATITIESEPEKGTRVIVRFSEKM